MRQIYIDHDYKCHIASDGTMEIIETDVFDGKCTTYVEGFRLVPHGESWTRPDGVVFTGEMISPWENLADLEAAQRQHEAMMEELDAAYREGVNSV